MDTAAAGIGAGLILVLFVLAVVLVICWIILPFAVLGTKPLLRELLIEQRRTNELLREVLAARRPVPTPGQRVDPPPIRP